MGLSIQSVGPALLNSDPEITKSASNKIVVALAGNPNVGKSTVFNGLTGMKQHTGNWPGKTVTYAKGLYKYQEKEFLLVDLPGTYSLSTNSVEEEIARDFICFAKPDVTLVVLDATCLERNMYLLLQILEITSKVVVCVNLIDEAQRKNISIDIEGFSKRLGVPVVGTNARKREGFESLKAAVCQVAAQENPARAIHFTYCSAVEEAANLIKQEADNIFPCALNTRWLSLRLLEAKNSFLTSMEKYVVFDPDKKEKLLRACERALQLFEKSNAAQTKLEDIIVTRIVLLAENIVSKAVHINNRSYDRLDRFLDSILTSRIYGLPIMAALLGVIFWITIIGANYPSALLSAMFSKLETFLSALLVSVEAPKWFYGLFIEGMYRTLAWVVSVMLPPMAIFFPLFTLLEDIGYLPRAAFNLDSFFKKACAHGKQALTMCMGFGCNAAGVIGCRIIDSPRERLIAIITNNFVPCNGRFPMLIALSSIFLGSAAVGGFPGSIRPAIAVAGIVVIGVVATLASSWLLSHTILKGIPSSFTLELPPYRKPQVGQIIVRSILDRTLFVLARAVAIAVPAGILTWLMANMTIGDTSLLAHCAAFLDPFARLIGIDGYILMAFILGIPANEIVLPIIIMSYTSAGSMVEFDNLVSLYNLLVANGWTWLTAVCVMLFSLMHFPCGTTLWTIKKETGSLRWTLVSFMLPSAVGILCCFLLTQAIRLFQAF